jgi:hypothetical protein
VTVHRARRVWIPPDLAARGWRWIPRPSAPTRCSSGARRRSVPQERVLAPGPCNPRLTPEGDIAQGTRQRTETGFRWTMAIPIGPHEAAALGPVPARSQSETAVVGRRPKEARRSSSAGSGNCATASCFSSSAPKTWDTLASPLPQAAAQEPRSPRHPCRVVRPLLTHRMEAGPRVGA